MRRFAANPRDRPRGRLVIKVLLALALLAVIPAVVRQVSGDSATRPPPPRQLSSALINRVRDSTILVVAYGRDADGPYVGVGSGWIYDAARGLVVTNAHVVEGATRVRAGQPHAMREASVERAWCGDVDLAVLRLERVGEFPHLELAADDWLRGGDRVFAAGYPPSRRDTSRPVSVEAIPLSVTYGVVESVSSDQFAGFVEHSAAVDHGNSGGPLVNTWGQLVGMNTLGDPGSGVGFAIPVDTIRAEARECSSG